MTTTNLADLESRLWSAADELRANSSPAIQTPPEAVAGIRFTNDTINGQLVRDAYIYRLAGVARDIASAG